MKRAVELRGLSEDHHQGLVLARRAARGAVEAERVGGEKGEAVCEAVWEEIVKRFGEELEPHFRIEEETLAPAMEAVGQGELMGWFWDDHAELRGMVKEGSPRTVEGLRRFADVLERHVRFEEREVFDRAQWMLSPEALGEIAAAWRRVHGESGGGG